MPEGYGVPATRDGLLDWSDVEARLVASSQYWMATIRPDGRPHVVPRWGVWVDGRLWYDGAPTTRHAGNLTHNPACTLHLEDGWKAVIVDGTSQPAAPPALEFGARLVSAFAVKYSERGYEPQPDSWEGPAGGGLMAFTPVKALAWFDFPTDVTRFRFTA
jgi:nitroimidazol reductase NimA-like FMN-containing flavoprotein (pyridoxamine 5'-phosphate oxidase superfamily)